MTTEMFLQMIRPFVSTFVLLIMLAILRLFFIHIKYKKSQYRHKSGNGFFETVFDKGNYGEFLIFQMLEELKGNNKILTNVYIPKKDGSTTEVDVLLIHATGIYIFESKNYSGWIFGNEESKYWTQTLKGGKKHKFFNPVWQNKAHINAVKQLIKDVDEDLFYSYIVFSERCELKKISGIPTNIKVIRRSQLNYNLHKDMRQKPAVLAEDQVNRIYKRLKKYTLVDDDVKQKHIKDMKEKYNKE